jgi:hypothetical protein
VDAVYSFTPTADGTFTATLLEGVTVFDAVLYVVTDCSGITDDTCIIADDAWTDGGDTVTFDGTAGTTYYIIVDGYTADDFGEYTITVE